MVPVAVWKTGASGEFTDAANWTPFAPIPGGGAAAYAGTLNTHNYVPGLTFLSLSRVGAAPLVLNMAGGGFRPSFTLYAGGQGGDVVFNILGGSYTTFAQQGTITDLLGTIDLNVLGVVKVDNTGKLNVVGGGSVRQTVNLNLTADGSNTATHGLTSFVNDGTISVQSRYGNATLNVSLNTQFETTFSNRGMIVASVDGAFIGIHDWGGLTNAGVISIAYGSGFALSETGAFTNSGTLLAAEQRSKVGIDLTQWPASGIGPRGGSVHNSGLIEAANAAQITVFGSANPVDTGVYNSGTIDANGGVIVIGDNVHSLPGGKLKVENNGTIQVNKYIDAGGNIEITSGMLRLDGQQNSIEFATPVTFNGLTGTIEFAGPTLPTKDVLQAIFSSHGPGIGELMIKDVTAHVVWDDIQLTGNYGASSFSMVGHDLIFHAAKVGG